MQKYSKLYVNTKKQAPSNEVSNNAKLLIKAGFINKEMAGVYAYLPLGLRVLNKIIQIIREEMNQIGGQEVLLGSLQNPDTWKKTNRWDDKVVDVWFKTQLHNGNNVGLANTHEEALANIMTDHVQSYKDLPAYLYQFQTKFRNEPRAKSGIMRTREFIMKDLYSFNKTQGDLDIFYESAKKAYLNVFSRVGIKNLTYTTFASGGSFSKFSHEFQTICDVGEDTIYVNKEKNIAINKEVYNDKVLKELNIDKSELKQYKAVEVGNIFKLGTKYSEALGLTYQTKEGKVFPVVMGSYGIGPGRLMGTVVECFNDEKGIIWPTNIAPYHVHFITLDDKQNEQAKEIIQNIENKGYEVLWDETQSSAGEKFANADLIGCPARVLLSKKSLESGGVEIKFRNSNEVKIVKIEKVVDFLQNAISI